MPHAPPPEPGDADPDGRRADDPSAAFRHDLKTPLTAISGQMQLARRRLRRTDGPDRDYLLARLAAIEAAIAVMGERIERLGRDLFAKGGGEPPRDDGGGP